MRRLFALTVLLFIPLCANAPVQKPPATDLAKAAVAEFILSYDPTIQVERAHALGKLIVETSHKHSLDYRLVTYIIAQESGFRSGVRNDSGDLGIMQVNYPTWGPVWKLDRKKLRWDDSYAINVGTLILAELRNKYGAKERFWWSRYNSNIPSKRHEYEALVGLKAL